MVNIVTQGFSLLHVMVFLAAMSSLLMLDSRFHGHRSDASSIEYTVLATEYLLNAAYAHYQESGGWPRASSGNRCAISYDRLNFYQAPKNGWGEDISVQGSCRHAGPEYVLEQRVPAKWASQLRERLDGSLQPASGGFELLRVTMDRSGGATNVVQYGNLSGDDDHPLRFSYTPCQPGEKVNHFSNLMSAFAFEYSIPENVVADFNDVFNGMRVVEDLSVSGEVAITYNMYRYLSTGEVTDRSASVDINSGNEFIDDSIEYFAQDPDDGHSNSDYRCDTACFHPERNRAIKVGFFSGCERI